MVWKAFKDVTLLRTVKRLVYAYSAAVVFGNNCGAIIYCKGVSMLPTMQEGDIIFAERLSVAMRCLHRNDIVCLRPPNNSGITVCKRLSHKEMDIVTHENEQLLIPPGHCYVLGDNIEMSMDSREYGAIPLALVDDRVVLRFWPPKRFGWLSTHAFYRPEEEESL